MISFLQPLSVGNAVRVLLAPPEGASGWKILRRAGPVEITGEAQAGTAVVYGEGDDATFFDTATLTNGELYQYAPLYRIGADWVLGDSHAVTPAATSDLLFPNPVKLIRDRLAAALKADVQAGRLTHENGSVPTLTAPPAFDGTRFPIVTVQLRDDSPSVRALGEMVLPDTMDGDQWLSSEGWLSRVQIEVVSWIVSNPDTRVDFRNRIKAALLGNMAVFDQAGISEFEFRQNDTEDFESYNVPMYQTITSITCIAPSVVTTRTDPVDDVTVTATPYEEAP